MSAPATSCPVSSTPRWRTWRKRSRTRWARESRAPIRVQSMSDRTVLHVRGRVLVGPEDVRDELWVVGGRISYERPAGARDIRTVDGWALPGLVDAHCHVGLGLHGPVPADVAEKQALTDREAGTLLLR